MPADPAGERILIDTNVVILRRHLPPGAFSGEVSISAVTLAELDRKSTRLNSSH